MDSHADAIARAKAISARLASLSGVAAPAIPGLLGASSHAPPMMKNAADVQAMLDMALGGGGSVSVGGNGGVGGGGNVEPHPPLDLSQKRGVEEALASLIPGLGTIDKRQQAKGGGLGGGDKAVKKIWIPSDRNPGYKYVGLLIGPGERQKERRRLRGSDGAAAAANNNQTTAGNGSAIAAALAAAGQRDSVSVGSSGTAMAMVMTQQQRGKRQ